MHGNCCICFVKLIQQIDDNIKTNGWGFINLLKIYNSVGLLSTFELFYHNHGRLPLKNGLLINPDGEVPEEEEKINLKISMKCSDIQNHMVCHSGSFPT